MRAWLAGRVVLAACAAALASAQPARSDDPVYRADEIVIEGEGEGSDSQPPLPVFEDAPIEKETIPRESIERRPGTTAADVLRTLPGIRQQQRVQGEEAAVSIEGMPPEFTRALVDGDRYAGEIGAVDDFRTIPVADAERVEVLRGPQALRYGSEAAGGVVRIDTPTPPREGLTGRFEGGYGGSEWIYGAGSVGYGNERVGGWLRFVSDEIDGFGNPEDRADGVLSSAGEESRRVSRDVYGKLRGNPRDGLELITRFGWRNDDESGLSGARGVGDRQEERWLAAQDFGWELGPVSKLSGSVGWYDDTLNSDLIRSFELQERQPSGRMVLEHLIETGPLAHALSLGFDTYAPRLDLHEDSFVLETGEVFEAPEPLDETQVLGGVYLLSETELTSWLRAEGGVRAQFHSDYSPQALPQIALLATAWRPDEQRFLRFRGSFGLGYRTPSLRDLYQPPVPQLGATYFLEGNPDLDPEHVKGVRFGVEAAPIPRLALSATAFWNDIDDHIRSTRDGSVFTGTELVDPNVPESTCATFPTYPGCDGEPITVLKFAPLFRKANLDSVSTHGVETRLRARLHPRVDVELAYTWLQTKVEDSDIDLDELPNEPEHVIDALISAQLPRTGTRVSAQARWRGEALTETSGTGLLSFGTTDTSDPSLILDLRVVQPIVRGFEVYADLFNATDESVVDSYRVRGRTFFVGLRGSF